MSGSRSHLKRSANMPCRSLTCLKNARGQNTLKVTRWCGGCRQVKVCEDCHGKGLGFCSTDCESLGVIFLIIILLTCVRNKIFIQGNSQLQAQVKCGCGHRACDNILESNLRSLCECCKGVWLATVFFISSKYIAF